MGEESPELNWEQLKLSAPSRELFRFKRGAVSESYNLRVVNTTAELWLLTYRDEALEKADKLYTFNSPQEALKFVLEMKERFGKEGLI